MSENDHDLPKRARVEGGCYGWTIFQVGDLVTRDGTDIHRVVAVDEIDNGQCIEVECVKPAESGWCSAGDREDNMARRYELIAAAP